MTSSGLTGYIADFLKSFFLNLILQPTVILNVILLSLEGSELMTGLLYGLRHKGRL